MQEKENEPRILTYCKETFILSCIKSFLEVWLVMNFVKK